MPEEEPQKMFDIRKFVSEIQTEGLASPTRYSIMFSTSPTGTQVFDSPSMEILNTRLQNITLPAAAIASKPLNNTGLDREMPYARSYEGTIDMEFLEDKSFYVRNVFDNWQNIVINRSTLYINYYDTYVLNLDINLHPLTDTTREKTYSVTLENTWPKTIHSIELGADKGGDIIKTKVTLSYRTWSRGIGSS